MENKDNGRSAYERVREQFQHLRLEERATFLVEATAATVLEGARRASESLADEVNQWAEQSRKHRESPFDGPGPAEPEPESTNHAD